MSCPSLSVPESEARTNPLDETLAHDAQSFREIIGSTPISVPNGAKYVTDARPPHAEPVIVVVRPVDGSGSVRLMHGSGPHNTTLVTSIPGTA